MYHISIFIQLFFKFFVHEINYKMIKSRMVMLTEKEKANVADADVAVDCILQRAAGALVGERERES
jgi:hypothetical protein